VAVRYTPTLSSSTYAWHDRGVNTANLGRDETAARSAALKVSRIEVELDLRGAKDPAQAGFSSITTLHFEADVEATWIDFIGEVHSVVLNDIEQPVDYDGARIRLSGLKPHNTVVVNATALFSRSGEGMHRFVDPVDAETYLYTQYEPADSRRVMACFEQPDLKARYTFTVHAPASWQVLSNGAIVSETGSDAHKTVVFAETLPISSYITCVAAGPYHRVDANWKDVALGLYCRRSLADHFDADAIFEVTQQGLDFFDEVFAYPYPWGKYDQIFVPEYNLGAMENPGLVTFTESYVFRGAATEAQYEARANTILHEMAHMWFGDLVTMRWWDDLWLKESFADYMGTHVSAVATRFKDAWATFANRRKGWAYVQDQLPTTHPIVADIADLEAAKLNFDGITYAKGASVLKQLVAFVGEQAFFEGSRRYFDKYAFGNTTLEHLLDELSEVSGRDLQAWSDAWLQTSGVSTVWLDGNVLRQDPPRPHRLRVGLYSLDSGKLVRASQQEIDIQDAATPLNLPPADLVLINDDDLSYLKARLDDRSLKTAEAALSTLDDTLARALIWSSLWNATRDAVLPVSRYLAIVRAQASAETNPALLASILTNVSYAVQNYVRGAEREAQRQAWSEATWQAASDGGLGADAKLTWLRAFAEASSFDPAQATTLTALLDGSLDSPVLLDADLRWSLVVALATTGNATDEQIAREEAADTTAAGAIMALRARYAHPDADRRADAWRAIWADHSLSNDKLDAVIAGFRAGGRRDLIGSFDTDYFAGIRNAWGERSIEIARRIVLGLFPHTSDLDLVDGWLEANPDAPAALRRLVVEQRDTLARALRVQDAQGGL
jgi:aminopeptidase N